MSQFENAYQWEMKKMFWVGKVDGRISVAFIMILWKYWFFKIIYMHNF